MVEIFSHQGIKDKRYDRTGDAGKVNCSHFCSTRSSWVLSALVRNWQFSSTITGRSAFSYLGSSISTVRLLLVSVTGGSTKYDFLNICHLLCSVCRLWTWCIGNFASSIVSILVWKSETIPNLDIVSVPSTRSKRGSRTFPSCSTISGCIVTRLLSEYSTNKILQSPYFSVRKLLEEVYQYCEIALMTYGMELFSNLTPFFWNKRSPSEPLSKTKHYRETLWCWLLIRLFCPSKYGCASTAVKHSVFIAWTCSLRLHVWLPLIGQT